MISNTKQNNSFIPIQTHCKVLSYDAKNNLSSLEVKLITGETYQIRAHLNFIGHPFVGEQNILVKNIKMQIKSINFSSL